MKNILLIISVFSLISSTFATETKFITDNSFKNVWLWQLSNTTLTTEKGISLANESTQKYTTKELLWTGKYINNHFYLGTGESSSILKINPNNFTEEQIFSSTNHAIIGAIVPDKSGILFATSPNSTLYHLDKNNKEITNVSLSNNYIWDIVPNNNMFYILTGLNAELYEYQDYKLTKVIEVDNEEHLLKGQIIDGTLWILGEKALYKKEGDKLTAITTFEGNASSFVYINNTFYVIHSISTEANITKEQPEQIFSQLTSVSTDGVVTALYNLQGFFFTSIHTFNNQLIVGSDQFGLYIVYDLITQKYYSSTLGNGKIIDIFNYNDSLMFLTTQSSGLWITKKSLSTEGSFTSEAYDTQHISSWGIFTSQVSTPPNTSITFYVQTGVTSNPSYWGKWYEVKHGQKIPAPNARYIRYKAILKSTGNSQPYVESVKFPYTQINLKPKIDNVLINTQNRNISITWEATDPNNDELEYNILLADDGLPKIKINNKPIKGTNIIIPVENYPAGYKRITIVASDAPSNNEKTQLTDTYQSKPTMLDGESPIISNLNVKKSRNKATISFNVTDRHSIIKKVSYMINGKNPVNLSPQDGIYDAKEKLFSFTISIPDPLFLQIQAVDSSDNKSTKGITILTN